MSENIRELYPDRRKELFDEFAQRIVDGEITRAVIVYELNDDPDDLDSPDFGVIPIGQMPVPHAQGMLVNAIRQLSDQLFEDSETYYEE